MLSDDLICMDKNCNKKMNEKDIEHLNRVGRCPYCSGTYFKLKTKM